MTDKTTANTHRAGGSILVVSRRPEVAAGLARALPEAAGHRITDASPSFAAMNGRASTLVSRRDLVIFDAPL